MNDPKPWQIVVAAGGCSVIGVVVLGLMIGGHQVGPLPAISWLGLIVIAIQWLAFVPSALLKDERFFDITGSLSFVALTAFALVIAGNVGQIGFRQGVTAALVAVWAVRLGMFLFARVLSTGRDGRFDEIKTSPARFFVAWTLQGVWVFLTALPATTIILHTQASQNPGSPALLGWTIFGWGLAIEVVADFQKSRHNRHPDTRGQWIDSGLWSYSRHPNYLGEIFMWLGMWISGTSVYAGLDWVTVISPIFVVLLLTRVSGIPLVEARANKKWGNDPEYRAYKRRVSTLIPFWPED